MRWTPVLLALMLLPAASGETQIKGAIDSFQYDVPVAVLVTEGGVRQTHQNMAITIFDDEGNISFETNTMHEHDGLATFRYGTSTEIASTVQATADQTVDQEFYTPDVYGTGDDQDAALRQESDGIWVDSTNGVRGMWTIRDSIGVVASGWVVVNEGESQRIADLPGFDSAVAEIRFKGLDSTRLVIEPSTPNAATSILEVRDPRTTGPCDADVVIDPENVLTGNPIRITTGAVSGGFSGGGGPGFTSEVDYQLLRQGGGVLDEELVAEWTSNDIFGASTFRVPTVGVYNLWVDQACMVTFTAQEGSSATAEPEWNFTVDDGDVVFSADIPGDGHYEYPLYVGYTASDGTADRLVFAGKLHSHGGPVIFRIPDAAPGIYAVQFDAGPQDAEPLVGSTEPYSATLVVTGLDDEPEAKDTPAPLGLAFLLLVALAFRRSGTGS